MAALPVARVAAADCQLNWEALVNRAPRRVTTLPAAPLDGQEALYVADETAGVIWHVRYNAGSASAYKWEVIGGSALFSEVASSETTTSTSYAALGTAGPSVALPLARDYDVEIGFRSFVSADGLSTSMSYDIGGTGASDDDRALIYAGASASGGATVGPSMARARRKTGLSAVTLTAKYKTTGGTGTFMHRWMRVVPVRVG